jgi:hypothetical protein
MSADGDSLDKAGRYVEEAQRLVWEQKGRIVRLRAAGFDTLSGEQIVRLLEANLKAFQEYRRSLEPREQQPHPTALAAERKQ